MADLFDIAVARKLSSGGGGGSSWDAVIRLTHAENSGPDNSVNLTPSIVSGTFSDLSNKVSNGGCPCILVEYVHPWGAHYAEPMARIVYAGSELISLSIAGFSTVTDSFIKIGMLMWDSNNDIFWD